MRRDIRGRHGHIGTGKPLADLRGVTGGSVTDGGDTYSPNQGGDVAVYDGGDVTPPMQRDISFWTLFRNAFKRRQVQPSNVGVTSTGHMYDIGRPEYANPQSPFFSGTHWRMVGQQNMEPCINPHVTVGHATQGTDWNHLQTKDHQGAGGFSTPVQLGG
jgi:hypothetical protein